MANVGAIVAATGLTVAAVAPVAWVAVAGFALTGAGFVLTLTGFTTVLQRRVPDELRGRVMALWSIAFLGTRPIAAIIDGTLADLAGPRVAMAAPISVALVGAVLAVRLRRHLAASPDGPGAEVDEPAVR